jgi:hypothetical protein
MRQGFAECAHFPYVGYGHATIENAIDRETVDFCGTATHQQHDKKRSQRILRWAL